jgi:pteridine reductase
MDDTLQGKVALVTGAARRIGAAIARRLHARGANVIVHYRGAEEHAARLEKELNAARAGSALRVKGDLLAPIAPKAVISAALERWQRLDLLVNNASAFYPTPVGRIEPGHWEELVGSNLRAPVHADRPLKGYLVYSVAKSGLAALTRALALELAPAVRVNAVAPGAIAWPEDEQFDPHERDRIVATTPLARLGSAEDIAQAVQFLASAPFITGQMLAVDGGRSVFV